MAAKLRWAVAAGAGKCSGVRLLTLFLVVGIVLLLPFLFWGETFTRWLDDDAGIEWLRGFGAWGWMVVIALLVADLFLPIPATPVMSAAGFLYGGWIGGLASAAGSFLAGQLGYWLCRRFGRGFAVRLAGENDLLRAENIFDRSGAWLVALSRSLPLLPEVVSCLAGLARMPPMKFTLALACGCLPMGFAYAAIGAAGQSRPGLALALSALVPALLWVFVQWRMRGAWREN